MLDHAGEALAVAVSFWRFVFGASYRRRKLAEWREATQSRGGRLAVAGEIIVSMIVGLGLPILLAVVVMSAMQQSAL